MLEGGGKDRATPARCHVPCRLLPATLALSGVIVPTPRPQLQLACFVRQLSIAGWGGVDAAPAGRLGVKGDMQQGVFLRWRESAPGVCAKAAAAAQKVCLLQQHADSRMHAHAVGLCWAPSATCLKLVQH